MLKCGPLMVMLAGAVMTLACTIPTDALSSNITYPFRAQVQNASRPEVHNQYMNLFQAGGGDQHLFIGPVGVPTYDLTLVDGVINDVAKGVRAVIGGEYSDIDHTTKMFMTGRGDPRAVFQPTYACNPDTDELQIELSFVTWQNQPAGGWICVRSSFDNSFEFRYYPPANNLTDPNRECIKVTLVVIPTTGLPPPDNSTTTTSTPTPTDTATSLPVSSPSTTTTPSSTATATPSTIPAYTDLTPLGYRFLGCAPEERWTTDGAFRTLPDAMESTDDMTNAKCAAFCGAAGYAYAGTEWSRECWCGNAVVATRQPATTLASLQNCTFVCTGDAGEYCGGDSWLSLYQRCDAGADGAGGGCVNAVFT